MTPDGNGAGRPLELTITRRIKAPRPLVWKACTDPEHVTNWGPEGFTVEIAAYDLRPGGSWRACLHPTGEGKDLWQGGTFREVVEGRRLVYTFAWDEDEGQPATVVTMTLEDDGDGTLLTFHQAGFPTVESRDGHKVGWTEALNALAAHAEKLHAGGEGA